MNDQSTRGTRITPTERKRRWGFVARVIGLVVLVLIGGVFIAQRVSDGPLNAMLPGGPLRAGTLASNDASLAKHLVTRSADTMDPIELQLVDPPTSRYTGIMLHDGQVYVPCDLGYMWGRFEGRQRTMLHVIYLFKDWHEDALEDGRVVVRVDGVRYEGQAVRVTNPVLDAALRAQLETMAARFVAPDPLPPAPTEPPNDIWFFRIDPRA